VRLARALTGGTGGCCSTLQVGELPSHGIGLGGKLGLGLGGGRLGLFFVSLGFVGGEPDWVYCSVVVTFGLGFGYGIQVQEL
jgi:hypothetical protein